MRQMVERLGEALVRATGMVWQTARRLMLGVGLLPAWRLRQGVAAGVPFAGGRVLPLLDAPAVSLLVPDRRRAMTPHHDRYRQSAA